MVFLKKLFFLLPRRLRDLEEKRQGRVSESSTTRRISPGSLLGRGTPFRHLSGVQAWRNPPWSLSAVWLAWSSLRNEEETCENPMRR